jgi:hypothetical protein
MAKQCSARVLASLMAKDKMVYSNARKRLDPNGTNLLMPLVAAMNDRPEIRVEVFAKMVGTNEPLMFIMDMTMKDYNALADSASTPAGPAG